MLSRRRFLVATGAAAATLGAPTAHAAEGRLVTIERTFAGDRRHALLWIPRSVPRDVPTPLVLAMHGGGGDARTTYRTFAWGDSLAAVGWYGLFPTSDTSDSADREREVDFVLYMLAEALPLIRADRDRLFAAGFSAGGGRVYQIAALGTHPFAALAPVAAFIGEGTNDPVPSWSPAFADAPRISLLHLHGGEDPQVPLEGGVGDDGRERVGMWEGLAEWVDYLDAAPISPPDLPRAPSRVVGRQWMASGGQEVVGMVDPGLGHRWPSWANAAILEFFDRVPSRRG